MRCRAVLIGWPLSIPTVTHDMYIEVLVEMERFVRIPLNYSI